LNKLTALGLVLILLGIITILPAPASKPNLMGFTSVCSFAPNSTVILVAPGIIAVAVGLTREKKKKEVREGA